eukprot:TRINITY_DN68695_c0_g1_i1.p1 TRINITY_DN68695_c0_g1~~TRINITY_DN68695_c0_g1_i1.p1  ORF type:complete len:261 (+),score=53.21 TRINITY_DN68695_c0_g1_i1:50-784(+)
MIAEIAPTKKRCWPGIFVMIFFQFGLATEHVGRHHERHVHLRGSGDVFAPEDDKEVFIRRNGDCDDDGDAGFDGASVSGANTDSEYRDVNQAVEDQMAETDNIDIPDSLFDTTQRGAATLAGASADKTGTESSAQGPGVSEYDAVHNAVKKQMEETDNVGEGVEDEPSRIRGSHSADPYKDVAEDVLEQMRETDNIGEVRDAYDDDDNDDDDDDIDDDSDYYGEVLWKPLATNFAGAPISRRVP